MTTTSNQTKAASASRAADGQNVTAAIADIVRRSEKARAALAEYVDSVLIAPVRRRDGDGGSA